MIRVEGDLNFALWRGHARKFVLAGTPPEEIRWGKSSNEQAGFLLLDEPSGAYTAPESPLTASRGEFKIDRGFIELGESVSCARSDEKWDLLYRLLYRLRFENPHLLKVSVDTDVLAAQRMAKSVHRDIHKMHAFVRFKKIIIEEPGTEKYANKHEAYLAWHQPEHLIVERAAPFFVRRFGDKPWSIFTPDLSAHWNGQELTFSEGKLQNEFPHEDVMDEVWKTYYRSIFNPARIKLKAMNAEMAPKYWASLPEAEIIRDLVREAPERLTKMAQMQAKSAFVPTEKSLDELRRLARDCDACPLAAQATQTVFGQGPESASIMIVGEQPGDQEDLSGQPFAGPAGEVLEEALKLARIDRSQVYITNAVKHFKWKPRGKMRLHQKPSGSEMHACRPWLEAEIAKVNPKIVVLLGTTAGTSVLGRLPKISEERGRVIPNQNHHAVLSWHPSAILRSFNEEEKQSRLEQLVADLRLAREHVDPHTL